MTSRKQYESSDEWAAGLTAIIQRERSEAALSEAEARYRWLFEAARDGILTLDAQSGKISAVNLFLCELLAGYEALRPIRERRDWNWRTSFQPHVALLALDLPGVDGFEMARRLCRDRLRRRSSPAGFFQGG